MHQPPLEQNSDLKNSEIWSVERTEEAHSLISPITIKQPEKYYWTRCSPMQRSSLKKLIGDSLGICDRSLFEFMILKNMGLAKSRVRNWNSGGWTSGCSRTYWIRVPGKLSLETKEKSRAGSSLRMTLWKHKILPTPGIRNPAEETGNQNAWARTCWSNWG